MTSMILVLLRYRQAEKQAKHTTSRKKARRGSGTGSPAPVPFPSCPRGSDETVPTGSTRKGIPPGYLPGRTCRLKRVPPGTGREGAVSGTPQRHQDPQLGRFMAEEKSRRIYGEYNAARQRHDEDGIHLFPAVAARGNTVCTVLEHISAEYAEMIISAVKLQNR